MAFVRGHWRRLGWVVSHYRRPRHDSEAQLALDQPPAVPAPRASPDLAPFGADLGEPAPMGCPGRRAATRG